MKILKVIASLASRDGGPYKTVPELAEALVHRGHTVDIYTTNIDGNQELNVPLETPLVSQGVRTTYFPVSAPRFWKFSYSLALALKRDIPSYDIVHVYSLYLFHGIVASHYCRKYGVPYIIQPHGALDPYLRRRHAVRKWIARQCFENRNIQGANAILFNTEEEQRLALPVIGAKTPLIVPLGLHLEEYRHLPERGLFRSKHPELQGKKTLLFLSRINFKKGLDILVDAFARLVQIRKNLHLVIAGPDNEGYAAQVRKRCQDADIIDSVTFAGMLSEADKRSAFVDADLFVLTSYTENFGVTILEAMACGTPVLLSDHVNIWREVVGGEAGCVTRCDANEIATTITSMLDQPEILKKRGMNGMRLVREHFDWAVITQQQEAAYQGVLSNHLGYSADNSALSNVRI